MQALSRQIIADSTGGAILGGADGFPFRSVFTDTRRPIAQGLFFALDGPNFNAHNFLSRALKAGAGGVVISNRSAIPEGIGPDVYVLLVDNTRHALGQVGRSARLEQKATVVAITGSVGKTTMKNMVAAALAPFGKVGRTPGNYNNDVGLPLTLCGFEGDEDFIVLELGMNAPGEIDYLTSLAVPDVGLVTGAHAAHLEFFPNIDAIADAKAELYSALGEGASAVANGDDTRILSRAERFHPERLVTYGHGKHCTARVTSITSDAKGVQADIVTSHFEGRITIPALGEHHALHAAGALAVVETLGLDVTKAAQSIEQTYQGEKHRMTLLTGPSGVRILDDCYNASPVSMEAALKTFEGLSQGAPRRIAVLGSMLELGENSQQFHTECGRLAGETGIDRLFAVGPFAEVMAESATQAGVSFVRTASDVQELIDSVVESTVTGTWLLLKGSRGGRLERVLDSFKLEEAC
jgi:UDP-N-acetylmuramoyl-tripeptide--D-alanyl-D-alanine ligase